ncbi:hypothetical protein [Georgenia sp. AZ-5]|uniref:hypothetical protein n=1 Tax=Georgenia sp. AZ-5 TaxID=3367526 RepID=UPI0037541CC1
MTGAVMGMLVAMLCALAVLAVLAVERRPEGGWSAWLRESLRAWRSDDGDALRAGSGRARDVPLEDLFSLGEPDEPAYARPEELRQRFEQAREQARTAVRR